MGDFFTQLRSNISNFINRLSFQQKLSMLIAFVFMFAILIVLFVWSSKPNFVVLYSNLNQKDAGTIVEKLQEKKINYKISDVGNSIMVPASQVRELRLSLAKEGLPEESEVGYELFDRSNLGMTDFVQKLNYRRALEGELARTIEQIQNVSKARVHIVLPEKALFAEDQKETTASVVLKLKGKTVINEQNVQAIIHLVSSSVEGLQPENVTIIDTRGKLLSNQSGGSDLIAMSATQMELRQKVENYLSKKAQSMLDNILGPGNAVVRVAAELNFNKVEKTVEQYDPDNSVVISEQINESEENDAGAQTSAGNSKSSQTTTNYEVNKTIQHIVQEVGNVKRLSVSVVVNNIPKLVEKEGQKTLEFEERSRDELNKLGEFVKNSVGLDETRGDKLMIQATNFSSPMMEDEFVDELNPPSIWDNVYEYLKYAVVIIAIIITILLFRSITNTVTIKPDLLPEPLKKLEESYAAKHEKEAMAISDRKAAGALPGKKREPGDIGDVEEELSEEVLAKSEFREKIRKYVEEKPDEAIKLLRVWMYEEEEE